MDVTLPDGQVINGVPEGTTKAQLAQKLHSNGFNVPQEWLTPASSSPREATDVPRQIVNGQVTSADPNVQLDEYGTVARPAAGMTYKDANINYKPPTWEQVKAKLKNDAMGLVRGVGRAGRNTAQGALGLPALVGDAPAMAANAGLELAGADSRVPTVFSNSLQALDSPQLQDRNAGERLQSDVQRAVAGAATGIGAGGAMGRAASPVIKGIGGALESAPAMQAASATSGATAAGLTREAGGGQMAQLAAGLGGGLLPPALGSGGSLLATTAKNVIRPVTKTGQEQMAADILQSQAQDPLRAVSNLRASQDLIPGSEITTGPASKDVGLLALEKGIRGKNTAAFGQRISEQNSARQAALDDLAGTPADVQNMKAARDVATSSMREDAFRGSVPLSPKPIHDKIDQILASPAGKRETVSKTMEWAKGLIGDNTDPATLYEIRKDLQLAQRGKLQPTSKDAPAASVLALAKGQLGDVISTLDNTIETNAPGFKAYLARYKELSGPIDQKQILQEIQKRAQLQSMDPITQEQVLGPANFGRAVDSLVAKHAGKLNAEQLERLKAIRTDLQLGQAINSAVVKAPGSDTFQNLSIAQVIGAGSTAAHPMLKVIAKPLSWLYKLGGTDEAVNEILSNAMLDPKMAARLLEKADVESVKKFSESLRVKAMGGALGTQAQLAANRAGSREDTDSRAAARATGR